jgi:exopolyphosphatase/guanosine-5'-triphosphate,3'-diphosphate pyrophosphatase
MVKTVGVLDVGCFSAHLVVVDGGHGRLLRPVESRKVPLRLDREIDPSGRITTRGVDNICHAVAEATRRARQPFVAYATSSIRDARNSDHVVKRVERKTGVRLRRLSPEYEAFLSYVAARQWFGCSAGALTVLDIGGGTVELAAGEGPRPSTAHSIPLGARTLTRTGLSLAGMRAEAYERVQAALPDLPANTQAVGCSKVFQQLARLAGARPQRDGLYATRRLRIDDLATWIPRLAALSDRRRAQLPGISAHRAPQSLAGAVLAETLMRVTGHDVVDISPWSTKEGMLLTLLDAPSELTA